MTTQVLEDYGTVIDPTALRLTRLLPGPIERVWSFITDSEKRGKWLASGPMDLKVGGAVGLTFNHADLSDDSQTPDELKKCRGAVHQAGQITRLEAPTLLAMTWGEGGKNPPSEVTFELKAEGDKVRMILTHQRLPNRGEMLSVAGGWHAHIGILIDVLEAREPRPFWATYAKLDAEYERRIPA